MKIRRFFCTVLSVSLIMSMTPVAWADVEEPTAEPVVLEEQLNEEESTDIPSGEEKTDVVVDSLTEESEEEASAEKPEIPVVEEDPEVPWNLTESEPCSLERAAGFGDLRIEIADADFSGEEQTPIPVVKLYDPGFYLDGYSDYNYDEYIELVEGVDFTVSYVNNIDPGTATVIITGIDRFYGSVSDNFQIRKKLSVSNATISSITSKTYTGSAWRPALTVTLNGKELVKDTDYTLSFSDNTNAGTAEVVVTGIGLYTGTKATTFTINKRSLAKANVTVGAGGIYTGAAKKPAVTVKLTIAGKTKTLKKGTDYTVTYSNNTKAGKAKVVITGKGNFKGSVTKYFTIKKRSVGAAKVTGVSNRIYTGKAIKPTPTVKLIIAGKTKTLKKGTDYTVTYKNNIKKGTATVIIKGKGNYTGTVKKTFKIMSRKDYWESRFAGTWIVNKVHYMGNMIDMENQPPYTMTASEAGVDIKLVLNRKTHKYYEYSEGKLVDSGSYVVDGNSVSITGNGWYGGIEKGDLAIQTGPRFWMYLRKK